MIGEIVKFTKKAAIMVRRNFIARGDLPDNGAWRNIVLREVKKKIGRSLLLASIVVALGITGLQAGVVTGQPSAPRVVLPHSMALASSTIGLGCNQKIPAFGTVSASIQGGAGSSAGGPSAGSGGAGEVVSGSFWVYPGDAIGCWSISGGGGGGNGGYGAYSGGNGGSGYAINCYYVAWPGNCPLSGVTAIVAGGGGGGGGAGGNNGSTDQCGGGGGWGNGGSGGGGCNGSGGGGGGNQGSESGGSGGGGGNYTWNWWWCDGVWSGGYGGGGGGGGGGGYQGGGGGGGGGAWGCGDQGGGGGGGGSSFWQGWVYNVSTRQNGGGANLNNLQFTYAGPSITSISPNPGFYTGGQATISGMYFQDAGTVTVNWGGQSLSCVSLSMNSSGNSSRTVNYPARPAGTVISVSITTQYGGTSNSVSFSYVGPPVVTGLSPSSGPLAGDQQVTVTGNYFTGALAVHFGSTPALSFTVVNSTTITAYTPASSSPEIVCVSVENAYGWSTCTSASNYTYDGAPVITSMSAYSGSAGTSVTVNGSGFDYGSAKVSAVYFCNGPSNCTNASTFTVVNDSSLNVTVPGLSPGTYAVKVTTPGGTTTASQ